MSRLPKYIRTSRKRAGLSQRHVAILLGSSDQTRISRYELNKRRPNVDVALALEIILGVPARTLFAGRFAALGEAIRKRAAQLPPQVATKLLKTHIDNPAPSVREESQPNLL